MIQVIEFIATWLWVLAIVLTAFVSVRMMLEDRE